MKKALSILFILFTIVSLSAQVKWGVKVGLNRNNIKDIHQNSKPRYGFQIGGLAQIPLDYNEQLYIQPELLYWQGGERNNTDDLGGLYDAKYYVNYIALPILLRGYLSDYENSAFVEGGPQFSFVISQNSTSDDPNGPLFVGPNDEVTKFDASLGLGIGFSYKRQFEIGLRYNYGLIDAYKQSDPNFDLTQGSNITSTFSLNLFYIFY